jgi:hypothetical protein
MWGGEQFEGANAYRRHLGEHLAPSELGHREPVDVRPHGLSVVEDPFAVGWVEEWSLRVRACVRATVVSPPL